MLAQNYDVSTPRDLQEANERLRREVAAHEETLEQLSAARYDLERRVTERTKELTLVKARMETALRGARVYVFAQDSALRFTWICTPDGEAAGEEMLGRTEAEMLPAGEREAVINLKMSVLSSGVPTDCEVSYLLPQGRTRLAMHIEPSYAMDGAIDGLICAAIDVSHVRSLESEQRRLSAQLDTALQRYETALRSSRVTIFTQDRELRYTSVSGKFLGLSTQDVVGRTDTELLPAGPRESVASLKKAVLDNGVAQGAEVHIVGEGIDCWFDLHIEPLRDMRGGIIGVTGAAVDITERKETEAHLRLLMREITHRSKNLLAVIQGMARQTARHAGSIEGFLEQFGARVQALATSHDLLVMESWHGVSLHDLVRSQLAPYMDRYGSQLAFDGPSVLLKPEAAQSLGLALYELASNAAKYGALATPAGRISILWERQPAEAGSGMELVWKESGGSPVAQPTRRGFGTLVIERHLARSLDAEVEYAFSPAGVCCRVQVPLAQFVPAR